MRRDTRESFAGTIGKPGRFELFAATRSVKDLKGRFGKPAKKVSIEDMNRAIKLAESLTVDAPGFVPVVAIVEPGWVLSSSYELTRSQVSEAFEALLRTKEIVIDRADHVLKALRVYKSSSADFADCLIERIASSAGCEKVMTFDVVAAKVAGMTLI